MRRLVTLAVVVLAAAGGIVLVGLPEEVPAETAPAVASTPWRMGDAGAYEMVLEGDWPYDGRSEGEPLPGPRFEAADLAPRLDAQGRWQELLHVRWQGPEISWDGWSEPLRTIWLRDGAIIATVDAATEARAGQTTYRVDSDCLLQPPEPGPLQRACRLNGLGIRLPAGTVVVDAGHVESDGVRARHLVAQHEDVQVAWWRAAGAPSAWRLEAHVDGEPSREVALQLVAFQRGAGRAPTLEPWDGIDLAWAPRQPWGPSEAGIDHPFGARAANEAARSDAEVAHWLDQHPEAYVFCMDHEQMADTGTVRHRWDLHFSDGRDGLSVRVVQGSWLDLPTLGARVERLPTHHLADDAPARERLPEMMPTVASMAERWRAQTGGDALGWGFCTVADGDGAARMHTVVGHTSSQRFGPNGLPVDLQEMGRSESMAVFDGEGKVLRVTSDERAGRPAATPPWTPAAMAAVGQPWQWSEQQLTWSVGATAGALALAWAFAKATGMGLFSRLHGPALLRHPMRQAIVDAVRDEPGIHFGALAQCVEAPPGQVRHHVRKLVDGDLLVERRSPGYTCYFAPEAAHRHAMDAAPAMRCAAARGLVEALHEAAGCSASGLASKLGISPSTVSYHLRRLEDAGIVSCRQQGRHRVVALTPAGRALVHHAVA